MVDTYFLGLPLWYPMRQREQFSKEELGRLGWEGRVRYL